MSKRTSLGVGAALSLLLLLVFLVLGVQGVPEAETHKTFIVCHKDGSVVVPGRLTVTLGDYVEFEALNTDVTVFIPQAGVFSANIAEQVVEIDATKSLAMRVLADAPLGEHPYAVFCRGDSRNFAEGNSSPVIIIEPPNGP